MRARSVRSLRCIHARPSPSPPRSGSVEPSRCFTPLAVCQAGSAYPIHFVPPLLALCVFTALLLGARLSGRRLSILHMRDRLAAFHANRLKQRLLASLARVRGNRGAGVARSRGGSGPLSTFAALPVGARVGVEVRDVSVLAGGALILSRSSVSLKAGSLSFVVGPSGGGKTTLLRTIMGCEISHGSVRFNGNLSPSHSARCLAFVPHDDCLPMRLAPHDVLMAAAALRCDAR